MKRRKHHRHSAIQLQRRSSNSIHI